MKTLTFEDIEREGLLLYKYKRGSLAQGTFIEGQSDIDTCSVYLAPSEQLLGLGLDYQNEVSDEKHDNVAWEFNKFMNLLLKSNPTVLESLFVDDEFVDYEHPIITELKKHRDKFITKKCFDAFGGYAVSQIYKCRSLNKQMLQDEEKAIERRSSLSFCYTFYNQGSTKIENWLAYRGLFQEYCGMNRIPNMHNTYGLFYDFGSHLANVNYTWNEARNFFVENSDKSDEYRDDKMFCFGRFICELENRHFTITPKVVNYRGIFKDANSTEVRLSSIDDKNDKPICWMVYNEEGFRKHCVDYKNYMEWKENRNPVRYANNKDKNYDAKNVSHAFRLMNMCIEIAEGKGFNVNRQNIDRGFLLDVKQHKYEYEEIMEMLNNKKAIMDEAISKSTLPTDIDVDFVNDFTVKVRKMQLGLK